MNWDQLKKNIGYRVQFEPVACRLDDNGRELPTENDDWIIQDVSSTDIRVANVRTGHVTTLGRDHVHHFTTNPDRSVGGLHYGFLTLNVQIFLRGNTLSIRPCSKPGEPVRPQFPELADRWVDSKYPVDCGLQAKLAASGFEIAWCPDSRLPRKVDLEACEIVIEPDRFGVPTRFHLKGSPENQTLIKRRNA